MWLRARRPAMEKVLGDARGQDSWAKKWRGREAQTCGKGLHHPHQHGKRPLVAHLRPWLAAKGSVQQQQEAL